MSVTVLPTDEKYFPDCAELAVMQNSLLAVRDMIGSQSPVVPSFCTETTAVRRLVAIHTRTTITNTNTLTRPDFDKTLLSLFSRRFSNTKSQIPLL